MKKSFSDTLNLPKSTFPPTLQNKAWVKRNEQLKLNERHEKLYNFQKEKLQGSKLFILHDGPPYANGLPHLGHAINKVLKDSINRYWMLQGRQVNYVPGWDCHGLPIELKALGNQFNTLSPLEVRQRARNYAELTVKQQEQVFKSWGIIGDWSNSYRTCSSDYVRSEMTFFNRLYKKGLIYRDFKPVFWSPSSQTALAEAELEYNPNHKSTAVYARFKLKTIPSDFNNSLPENANLYVVIWTTTPWTLTNNEAICINENLQYGLLQDVNSPSDYYIIAMESLDNFSKDLNRSFELILHFPGSLLRSCQYTDILDKGVFRPFLHGDYVDEKGTGLVHTSPNHGYNDFVVFAKNKLKMSNVIVDNFGNFNENVTLKQLVNKPVLSTGQDLLLDHIESDILLKSEYVHSYPYDWRTKLPVIIKASKQWFLNTNVLKDEAKRLLDTITFCPITNASKYINNMLSQLDQKEFWCISRQRVWGVPIPILYNNGHILLTDLTLAHFHSLLEKYGTDFWWSVPKQELVPEHILVENGVDLDQIEVSKDILDIWFDSGISWSNVLPNNKISDVVVEGIDQITGWFQSSLLTSIADRNAAPFKSIFIHSFITDEKGVKMSKSAGNVTEPADIIDKYGIDTFRWWLICYASHKPKASLTQSVLESSKDVEKTRLIFKFILGSLSDYTYDINHYSELKLVDKYMLNQIEQFQNQISQMYRELCFNKVGAHILNFIANDVSAFYLPVIKDRLYCETKTSPVRLSTQCVLWRLMLVFMEALAPIVPDLVEEVYSNTNFDQNLTYFQMKIEEFCQNGNVDNVKWLDARLQSEFKSILRIRHEILVKFKKSSHNLKVKIQSGRELYEILTKFEKELLEILEVAEYELIVNENFKKDEFSLNFETSNLVYCDRCRKYCCAADSASTLCNRCTEVLNAFTDNSEPSSISNKCI